MTNEARARGAQLRTYRTDRGWTQERLGQEAGLSTYHVYQLEHGLRGGLPATWVALADALDVPPLALLSVPAADPPEAVRA